MRKQGQEALSLAGKIEAQRASGRQRENYISQFKGDANSFLHMTRFRCVRNVYTTVATQFLEQAQELENTTDVYQRFDLKSGIQTCQSYKRKVDH